MLGLYSIAHAPSNTTRGASTMNHLGSYSAETALDAAFDDGLYSAYVNRPYVADAWATQLCEAPPSLFDPIFDASVARYDLPSDTLPRSSEASAHVFAAAAGVGVSALQIPPPAGASLPRASSMPSPGSDGSSNSPSCSTGLESPPHVSTNAEYADTTPKRRKKKRGRSKLDPIARGVSGASAEDQCTARIPHNKVERKYREGLNTELERLRRAVPTMLQSHNGSGIGQPKPSKSMVIAAAIKHIEMVTQQRDMLQNENDEIREYREETGEIRKTQSDLKGGWWSKKRRAGPDSE